MFFLCEFENTVKVHADMIMESYIGNKLCSKNEVNVAFYISEMYYFSFPPLLPKA